MEADCDVAFIKSGGALQVTDHRCKSEPGKNGTSSIPLFAPFKDKVQYLMPASLICSAETSVEDMCLGCPQLLPLNDTNALQMATASLATFNNRTANVSISKYAVLEVGRLTTQVKYIQEV